MKLTKSQLKQIIKEELKEAMKKSFLDGGYGFRGDYARDLPPESGGPPSSMTDPDFREDSKRRFEMYQKLRRILHNMEKEKNELDETDNDKKSPDDIVARFPSSRPGEPDQVIYRWQQDEFDERERAHKAFNKRKKK